MIKKLLRKLVRNNQAEDFYLKSRIALFKQKNIKTILDVGANIGQYAETVLDVDNVEVISFEPMAKEFDILEKKSKLHRNWKVHNFGLSNKNETAEINVSHNSFSSSFLELTPSTIAYDAAIAYKKKETVTLKKLDSIWGELQIKSKSILLKIDTQGYECNVLRGAANSLKEINGLQIEMSIEQLYRGEMVFEDLYVKIKSLGFELFQFEPGYRDPKSNKLLQVEGIFFKKT